MSLFARTILCSLVQICA